MKKIGHHIFRCPTKMIVTVFGKHTANHPLSAQEKDVLMFRPFLDP
jgi:hypothetical protein